jgi:hypothetical protein
MQGVQIAGKKLVLAPILRAGIGFLDGMLSRKPLVERALSRSSVSLCCTSGWSTTVTAAPPASPPTR